MIETKAMIIHEILRKEGPFKARHIYESLGLSAQNTSNHLSRLVDKGILIKEGTLFLVANKERLIDELISSSERGGIEKAVDVWPNSSLFSMLQSVADQIVRARILDKPDAIEAHIKMNHAIDDMAAQLKTMKKWLNNKSYTLSRAEKGFDEEAYGNILDIIGDIK